MCYIHFTYPVSLHRISNSSEFVILQLAAERDHSETDTAAEDSEEDSEEQAQSHQSDHSASDYEEQPEEPAKCVLQLLQQLISLPKARRELHLAKDQVTTQMGCRLVTSCTFSLTTQFEASHCKITNRVPECVVLIITSFTSSQLLPTANQTDSVTIMYAERACVCDRYVSSGSEASR